MSFEGRTFWVRIIGGTTVRFTDSRGAKLFDIPFSEGLWGLAITDGRLILGLKEGICAVAFSL